VGPEGYKGIVARQLQEFKRLQRERLAAAGAVRETAAKD
jgi:hypothetical protein